MKRQAGLLRLPRIRLRHKPRFLARKAPTILSPTLSLTRCTRAIKTRRATAARGHPIKAQATIILKAIIRPLKPTPYPQRTRSQAITPRRPTLHTASPKRTTSRRFCILNQSVCSGTLAGDLGPALEAGPKALLAEMHELTAH